MAKKTGPNKDNLEKTRALFLELASEEFKTYGYANASTNRIVEKSGMARGSLYYHFKDKKAMFYAVYIETMHMVTSELEMTIAQHNDSW